MKLSKVSALALTALVSFTAAAQTNTSVKSGGTQDCKGISYELVSLKRSDEAEVTAEFSVQNNNNEDRATFVYYGGARGKNTFLVDDAGNEWPKKKVSGNGNKRQALIAGVKVKYKLIFSIESGGQDATLFSVILNPHILPLSGMGNYGFCSLKFANVPLQQ